MRPIPHFRTDFRSAQAALARPTSYLAGASTPPSWLENIPSRALPTFESFTSSSLTFGLQQVHRGSISTHGPVAVLRKRGYFRSRTMIGESRDHGTDRLGAGIRKHKPQQLLLSLEPSPPPGKGHGKTQLQGNRFGLQPLDCRMNTTEVLRIVGVHRTTLYRWTRRRAVPGEASFRWMASLRHRALADRARTATGIPAPVRVSMSMRCC